MEVSWIHYSLPFGGVNRCIGTAFQSLQQLCNSAYCLCASIAARFMTFTVMFQQWRHSTFEPAVIFPAILVLLRRSNFIGVCFIEIVDCLSESGESVTSHTCFLNTIIFEKKNVSIFKFVIIFFVSKTGTSTLFTIYFFSFTIYFLSFTVLSFTSCHFTIYHLPFTVYNLLFNFLPFKFYYLPLPIYFYLCYFFYFFPPSIFAILVLLFTISNLLLFWPFTIFDLILLFTVLVLLLPNFFYILFTFYRLHFNTTIYHLRLLFTTSILFLLLLHTFTTFYFLLLLHTFYNRNYIHE